MFETIENKVKRSLNTAEGLYHRLVLIVGESNTGKTSGSDFDKNKPTLSVIHFLKTADKKEIDSFKAMLDSPKQNKKTILEMMNSFGSLEYAQKKAQQFVEKAIQALNDLKPNDTTDTLIQTAKFLANRIS